MEAESLVSYCHVLTLASADDVNVFVVTSSGLKAWLAMALLGFVAQDNVQVCLIPCGYIVGCMLAALAAASQQVAPDEIYRERFPVEVCF